MAKKRARTRRKKPSDDLLGPPPREATIIRTDAERREEEDLIGPGGSVATPDQNRVDEIGDALGVPRGPDEEIRTSAEILDERDRRRWDMEQP